MKHYTSTASGLGLYLLQVFREKHPGVVLHLVETISSHLEEMLIAGKLDLAILFSTQLTTDIERVLLFDERFFLIGKKSKRKSSGKGISLIDAAKRKLILPSRFLRVRRQLDDVFARRKIRPNIVAEVDSAHILVNAVIAGMGESIQPWSAIAHAVSELTLVKIADKSMSRPNYLSYRPEYLLSPIAHVARQLVRDEIMKLILYNEKKGFAVRWRT